ESGLQAWELSGETPIGECGEVRDDAQRHEHYLRLQSGCAARQLVYAPWNPGAATPDVPYSVRMSVRGSEGGIVRFEIDDGRSWKEAVSRSFAAGQGWTEVELAVPFAARFRVGIAPAGTGWLDVDDVAVFNHVQDAALFDGRGRPLG